MGQLDIFGLEGRVALVVGGGGAIGSALAEALAGAGARVAVAGRTAESCEATVERVRAAGSEGLAIAADATSEADCDADGRGDRGPLRPGRHRRQRRRRRRREGAPPGRGLPALRLGLDHGAERAQHGPADPGGGPDDDRRRPRRRRAQHLVGPRQPRDQRRLLRPTSRRRGRSARSPASGPPSGRSTGSGSTRSCRPSSTRRRWRACWRTPTSRPASSAGSRSGASARPATSSARRSSCAPTPPRS